MDDLETLANEIVESIPEPTESAIQSHGEKTAEADTYKKPLFFDITLVDKYGRAFDPAIHTTNDDGSPRVSAKNKLCIKAGAKPGNKNSSRTENTTLNSRVGQGKQESCHPYVNDTVKNPHGLNESQITQAESIGTVSASMLVNVSMMLGGEAFIPRENVATGVNEMDALNRAFSDWHIQTGHIDLPPNLALCFVVGSYMLPRFSDERVLNRIKGGYQRFKKSREENKNKKIDEENKKVEPVENSPRKN